MSLFCPSSCRRKPWCNSRMTRRMKSESWCEVIGSCWALKSNSFAPLSFQLKKGDVRRRVSMGSTCTSVWRTRWGQWGRGGDRWGEVGGGCWQVRWNWRCGWGANTTYERSRKQEESNTTLQDNYKTVKHDGNKWSPEWNKNPSYEIATGWDKKEKEKKKKETPSPPL